jgi:hypothetical protein
MQCGGARRPGFAAVTLDPDSLRTATSERVGGGEPNAVLASTRHQAKSGARERRDARPIRRTPNHMQTTPATTTKKQRRELT